MKKTASLFISLLFFFFLYTSAQENKPSINIELIDGKIVAEEEMPTDSLGFLIGMEEDDQLYEDIPYKGPSVQFLYFEWMSGYGLYHNFEVTSIHYKHLGNVNPDTLILGKYCHPAPFKVTSNYGKRRRRMHYGVDLGYPTGTPVVAAFNGIVRISQTNAGGYGNLIVIRHDNGLETYYGHLSKRLVNPGQVVQAGDTIALGGNTGRSYGSHLHFETRYLGTPFNPNNIIDFTRYALKSDTLYIRGCAVASNIAANTSTTAPAAKAIASTGNSSNNTVYYKVKNGDTLSHIARRYGTSVNTIKRLNGLRSDFLRIGQTLRVR